MSFFRPYPVVVDHARGARLFDVDGNEYVDVLNNYTALVHGHAFGPIVDAVAAASRDGSVYPAPHPRQLELAEVLVDRYPAAQRVRFTNSGTEAALLAARIARRATGRPRLLLFEGGYHGTAPDFLGETADTVRVSYNDLDALLIGLDGDVAAVFAEPFLGSGGVIPAADGFLEGVQNAARETGALFVLDEVQSLRNDYRGVHGGLGLRPDLVLMGKLIGGGLPVGAVGGDAELLALTASENPGSLPHSGTFNGNVLTCAAGTESLRHLEEAAIEGLDTAARALTEGIERAALTAGVGLEVTRSGSVMHVHLAAGDGEIDDAASTAALHVALLLEGVYAAPRGMLNLSTALTDRDLEHVADAYGRAFERVATWRDEL